MEPLIRGATTADVEQLVEMRHAFTFEDTEPNATSRPANTAECRSFLEDALAGSTWQIWVAELDGRLVAHVFVALIDKVPRPVRENSRIAYLTNVYTDPDFRGRGIGAKLVERAQEAAPAANVELMIVWPSHESVAFYRRHGFEVPDDPLIWQSRQEP